MRILFRTLAEESLANARRFFSDANRLRRVGSRGHAIAFAVLIENGGYGGVAAAPVAAGIVAAAHTLGMIK